MMHKSILLIILMLVIFPGVIILLDTNVKTAISLLVSKDINETSHHAETDSHYYVGGDDHIIYLQNNPHAVDVSYETVIDFVKSDETNLILYNDTFVCADFAEKLHNNAESNGIKAAWVVIYFYGEEEGHSLNAFDTTDEGLIYIDSTGLRTPTSCGYDRLVCIEIGEAPWSYEISECDDYYFPPFVSTKVESIEMFW